MWVAKWPSSSQKLNLEINTKNIQNTKNHNDLLPLVLYCVSKWSISFLRSAFIDLKRSSNSKVNSWPESSSLKNIPKLPSITFIKKWYSCFNWSLNLIFLCLKLKNDKFQNVKICQKTCHFGLESYNKR
jgi:hypothetical protein